MPASSVNWSVLRQHVESASFLWILRDRASRAADTTLDELADLDERVDAHLDGLAISPDEAWTLCEPDLDGGDPGYIFAGGALAFARGAAEHAERVVAAASAAPARECALVAALAWLGFDAVRRVVRHLMESSDTPARRIGFAAAAALRKDPGTRLASALADDDPLLRARALRAVAELARADLAAQTTDALRDEDFRVRTEAACACVRFGWAAGTAIAMLRDAAAAGGPGAVRAAAYAARADSADGARAWVRQLLSDPRDRRVAAAAAGAIGTVDLLDPLLDTPPGDPAAIAVARAVALVTHLDLRAYRAGGGEDETEEAGEHGAGVGPDLAGIREWWEAHRRAYRHDVRYLRGAPLTEPSLVVTLRVGTQAQRAAAAFELARLRPDEPRFPVRARARRQRDALGELPS